MLAARPLMVEDVVPDALPEGAAHPIAAARTRNVPFGSCLVLRPTIG